MSTTDKMTRVEVLAAMGARNLGSPIEESLPQSHLRALEKVAWPTSLAVA